MKKKLLTILLTSTLVMAILTGCGEAEEANIENENNATNVIEVESTEETVNEHTHSYVEEITKEPTCLEAGEKTLTCECGETKTEVIEATGHEFTDYVSNEDATYEADGTETAKCNNCDETDTRVAEGSMLTYTYEEMDATKYAKSTVNVRSLPTTDGEKLGGLSLNDEVKVTGKCNETGWYRIEYKDSVAYISDSYLVDNKVETKPAKTTSNSGSTASASSDVPTLSTYAEVKERAISLGYPVGGATDNGDGSAATYFIEVVDSSNCCSWDYEYSSRLADLEASRDAADVISGRTDPHLETYVRRVKIANCPDSNYTWYVFIGKC